MRRVCLLTGAGGAFGNAFCEAHARDYNIVAVYRENLPHCLAAGQELIDPLNAEADIDQNRSKVFPIRADLTDERDLDRIVELAVARFDCVDVLVNAAVHSRWSSLLDTDNLLSEASLQFEVNTLVPLRLAVGVARRCWCNRDRQNRSRNRNVINISSTAGHIAYPGSGQSIYAASKAALNMLTRHMAEEFLRIGVRVNAIAPNSFTSIVPIKRVVDSVVRLDRGTSTGTILVVDREGHRALLA
jgi:NAD(P)-dependent dehydrogenase (short-subunit alcohol dehydrogenase family)